MLQLRCIFTICHPPRQGHPGIICKTYLAQTVGPKVGLEWTDHYATQYNLRTGWPLNSEPVCRSGSWTPKESIPPILPQLKVELHDDQTFLMKKPFSTLYILSSFFYIFFFFLLSSIFNLSSTFFFSSFVKTETKCLLHLNHHLGVFHHALKRIPIHFKPV